MDLYLTTPVGPFPAAVGAAFASFTARQDVSPQPLPTLNPYQLRVGTKIKIEAEGEISTTGTPTCIFGFYVGTTASPPVITTPLAETGALSFATAAAWPWRMEYRGIVTVGAVAGQIVGMGQIEFGTSLTATTSAPMPITQALRTVTVDTTIARGIGVCATFSASSASNIVKTLNHSVLLLN